MIHLVLAEHLHVSVINCRSSLLIFAGLSHVWDTWALASLIILQANPGLFIPWTQSSKRDRERQRKRKKVGRRGRVRPLDVLGGNWCAVPASWGREIGLLDEMSFRVMDVWLQRVEQLQPFFANHLSYLPGRSVSPWRPSPLIFQQKPETLMFPQVKCWHPVQMC